MPTYQSDMAYFDFRDVGDRIELTDSSREWNAGIARPGFEYVIGLVSVRRGTQVEYQDKRGNSRGYPVFRCSRHRCSRPRCAPALFERCDSCGRGRIHNAVNQYTAFGIELLLAHSGTSLAERPP